MLADVKLKSDKAPDPSPNVLFAVVYLQDSMTKSQSHAIEELFSNVHGFSDADFDMDIDVNFHESESMFFDKLGYIKREDASDDESDKDADDDKKKAAAEGEEEKKTEEESFENRKPGCVTKKPVAFLERPEEVLRQ